MAGLTPTTPESRLSGVFCVLVKPGSESSVYTNMTAHIFAVLFIGSAYIFANQADVAFRAKRDGEFYRGWGQIPHTMLAALSVLGFMISLAAIK